MSLREKINKQFNTALKSQNKTLISTLRLVLAAIKDKDIANRTAKEKDNVKDDEIINVQVVGTSSELDKLISEIDANNPLEIVRSGSLGISSDEKTLTIEN